MNTCSGEESQAQFNAQYDKDDDETLSFQELHARYYNGPFLDHIPVHKQLKMSVVDCFNEIAPNILRVTVLPLNVKSTCVVYQPVIPVRTRVVQKHAQKHVQKVRVCWYRTCTRYPVNVQ
jgi:hypothetical protein